MNALDVYVKALDNAKGLVQQATNGLSTEEILRQPATDCNTIA